MSITVKGKLTLNIAAAILAIGSLIAISSSGLSRLAELQDEGAIRASDSSAGYSAAYIGASMYEVIADSVINRDRAKSEKDWAQVKQESAKKLEDIAKRANSPEEEQWAKEAQSGLNGMIGIYENKMLPLLKSDVKNAMQERIREVDGEIDVQAEKINSSMEKFANSMQKEAEDADHEFDAAGKATIRNSIIVGLVILSLVIALSLWILKSILAQLGGEPDYAAMAVGKISAGDLSMDLALKAGDNSSLLYSLKVMQDNLKQIVGEIQTVVNVAVRGDFSKKMDMRGKQGFGKDIATELNQLSNTVDEAFKDTIRVTNALAAGDLSQKITKEYEGAYNQVKVSVNTTAESLIKIVGEIQNLVEAAAKRGDFSVKMDMNGKQGYTKELSELLNQLSNVTETSLNELAHMLRALSQGDLNEKITNQYHGIFGQLANDANSTAKQLKEIILNEVGRVLEALSRGDLTEKISNDYPGAFGQLKDDANTTVAKLTEIIAQVKDSTDLITTAAEEIAQGNADLSQRTEEQASSLEETASSMEELTSTVKQNAENAKQANQLSMNASDIAVKGGKVVGEVVQTMASISTSSKKIVDIISVIEGIAFQTNILALNAAVEAARAGEQGRGFAVVAGEVRNLAQRSAAAAKEIKNLIDDSVGKVDTGSKQVDQAGATMSEIVIAVKRVTDIMAEISAASNEQSAGIEQVNQAITQMDDVTQQNAALVEEAAAAAESMQDQANALDTAMGTFKLDERKGGAGTAVVKHVAQPAAQSRKAVAAHGKERKLAKTRSDKDGDWKEF